MTELTFRKKPVEIQAFSYDGANSAEIVAWADDEHVFTVPDGPDSDLRRPDGSLLMIRTLEGMLHVSVGDWVIQGVQGEFYPCKPDIFAATYDPVCVCRDDGNHRECAVHPTEGVAPVLAVKCSLCRRERALTDAYDYNPLQVITGQPVGWYSGEDGELCPECMAKTLGRQ